MIISNPFPHFLSYFLHIRPFLQKIFSLFHIPTFSPAFQTVFENTPLFNGGKWLVRDVKREEQLEDVRRLVMLKAGPPKGKQ